MSDTPQPVRKPDLALRTIDDVTSVARAFAASGYFTDAAEAAQAFTKVMAGRELGLPPIAAMKDIYIVKGRVTLSARVIASLVKSSGKYDYRVKTRNDKECAIEFFEYTREGKKESLGVSTFTLAMAAKAGLDKNPTWKSFPENMLFARAMTNGVGTFCPDVTHGTVYAPDELDERFSVDADGNTVAPRVAVTRVAPAATPEPEPASLGASLDADKQALVEKVKAAAKRVGFTDAKLAAWLTRNGAADLAAVPVDGLRVFLSQLEEKAQLTS